MNKSDITTTSESTSHLEIAIGQYATKLDRLDSSETEVTETRVYEVLLARDAVENLLRKRVEGTESPLAELVELDQRLKVHNDLIGTTLNLKNWREVLNPPETAWWWYCCPTPVVSVWDRLDWLWNTLTITSLTMVGSLMINITNAMSAGGAVQWPETFMTLLQGTGLALVAGGTLTSAGQAQVEKLLEKLNIPPEFRAEATLSMAITLLLISTGIYNVLPKYLLYLGTQNYERGELPKALIRLTQASQIQPDNPEINIALGKVYESLNETSNAMAEYIKVIPAGLPEAFNSMGRVMIAKNPKRAEAILRLGVQRAFIRRKLNQVAEEESVDMRYQFRTNLGWALLQQERYEEAREELQAAVQFNEQFPDKQLGSGMASCFLIKANLALGNQTEAIENWPACRSQAHPKFLSEYQWIIDSGFSELANCLDTTSIVVGLEGVNIPELMTQLEICLKQPEFTVEPDENLTPAEQ
ncbi:MAG: tetratricopeptide repeat protein [Okeania sp. SIO2C9]|uniref:tetratricopeptide repeat protein n=1 Tax=Okeania sp. SIO2C9 TaxID=2607791 RepID=UPI0013C12397|nr:tetratricopeptide repeat protein [Okeania sp. SIO2C9]NEQ73285.1 tetratricopeptide repeat protein [Okeania sp. SIO2C9]